MHTSFSEANVARYKKLASGLLTAGERKAILDVLANELAKQRCLGSTRGCGTD